MSDSRKNRKSHTAASSPPSTETPSDPGFFDRIPTRLWFPLGFVGFFFTIGGWNQLASTWVNMTGSPIPGADFPIGLMVGSVLLLLCTLKGFLAWQRDRTARRTSRSSD